MIIRHNDRVIWTPGGKKARKDEFESNTSLAHWWTCPVEYFQYYAHTVERSPVTKVLILGRAIHETLADVMVEKQFHKSLLDADTVRDIFHTRWRMELDDGKRKGLRWDSLPSPEDLRHRGHALVEQWRLQYLPFTEPMEVEGGFWLELTGTKRALHGKMDLVAAPGRIIDYKTSGSEFQANYDVVMQMTIYHLAYAKEHNKWPVSGELLWFVTKGEGSITPVSYNISKQDAIQTLEEKIRPTLQEMDQATESGRFECRCGKHKDIDTHGENVIAKESEKSNAKE